MPLAILSATPRERPMILSHWKPRLSKVNPNSAARWLSSVVKLGVAQEALGGDAAPVQAGAAGAVAFDDGDFLAELRGADGSDVPGRAAADDDEIVVHDESWILESGREAI